MKPIVDSRQLVAFAELARCGSFTLAARKLSVTQSAVSHAIKALEKDVGSRLVDRIGKRVQLTPSGRVFLRHADNILREMGAARSGIQLLANTDQSLLRVGAGTTFCQHLLPGVITEFQLSHPTCIPRVEPGGQDRQLELLRSGHVDLAFLQEPPSGKPDDLVFVPLFEDELRFFVSQNHPWAEQQRVPEQALARDTVIVGRRTSHTYRLVSHYFKQERVVLGNVIELGSVEAIKEITKLGLGAGILAPWSASAELANGELLSLPLGRRKLRRLWSLAYWKGRHLTRAEQAFISLSETAARTLALTEAGVSG